jgi:superfamily I DNA and/or RNA helicase
MSIGSLIVGGGTLVVAAEIATWCFKAAAKSERQNRRDFVRSERAYRYEVARSERAARRAIERDTRRRLAQEAYEQRGAWLDMLGGCMESVWEMRKNTRNLRSQFQDIVRANITLLRTSPLTYQQQEAIRDCILHLERGIERLQAYSGPYLEGFISSITDAKRAAREGNFINPEMPDAVLPDDFPVVGDNLRLSPEETQSLLRTGALPLYRGQIGRLQKGSSSLTLDGEVDVFVEDYDREASVWTLSLAKGFLVSANAANTSAGIEAAGIEATLLSSSKGGFRAVWHSGYAESIDLFMPFALASPAMRSAPWGTRLPVFVHQTDYRIRRIVVGQRPPAPPDDLGNTIVVQTASSSVRDTIERALEVSPSTFWLTEGSPNLGPGKAKLAVRVATGEEFSVSFDDARSILYIGEQTGYRLGNVDGAICRSYVSLRFVDDTGAVPGSGVLATTEFLDRIRGRLEEQEELQKVFQEETLETRKYQLLLEAELEASKSSSRVVLHYSAYDPSTSSAGSDDAREVTFLLESPSIKSDLDNYALEVLPQSRNKGRSIRLCGFIRSADRLKNTVTCSFSDELLRLFLDRQIGVSGTLECSYIDTDTQRQVRALDQFRNVSFLQDKSSEDREAFRNLRRILLGLRQAPADTPSPHEVFDGIGHLNPDQERAVRLINSSSPLTLILGPPGTGKTDMIAIALEVFLRRSPGSRVAVVSQANVAVDEALKKLKGRYPECDIVRHVSAHAVNSVMDSSKDLTQHARRDEFITQLTGQPVLPEWATKLREQFRHVCKDERYVTHRVLKALVHSSAVYGCTLSILGRLSLGTPLFDIVVVDEAAKASLPECMIAALSAKRLVLVGDHHQLLPFLDERILDRAGPLRADRQAVQELWNNSLFKRMWAQADSGGKVLLTTQYRSRSGIREAISDLFYDGQLTPGRTDESDKMPFPCSLVWIDTKGVREDQIPVRKSLVNEREIDVVLATLDMLAHTLPNPSATSVAVICFYGEQRALIERVFRESPVAHAFGCCEARTVDASQGGQWDVVLLSLTRCDGGTSFVGNANRLNVALSRARELAVVIGSFRYALQDRSVNSKLGSLAKHIQSHKGRSVWICAPGPRGGIAPGFGLRGSSGGGDGNGR